MNKNHIVPWLVSPQTYRQFHPRTYRGFLGHEYIMHSQRQSETEVSRTNNQNNNFESRKKEHFFNAKKPGSPQKPYAPTHSSANIPTLGKSETVAGCSHQRRYLAFLTPKQSGAIMFICPLQKAFKTSVVQTEISEQPSVNTLGHSFATHLLEQDYDIRTIQELLDHRNLQTTMIYPHVATKNILGVKIPLDR